jgi:hypothetical protein
MSEAKSVFRKLAMEVHPDHGGQADKFREIMKYKNDYQALCRLASKWGIVLDGIDTSASYQERLEAVVGALVRHTFTYKKDAKSLYGVIFKIRTIKKGYHRGAKEFSIFDLESGMIWKMKTYEKQPFNAVVGRADVSQLRAGEEKEKIHKERKKTINKIRQQNADNHFDRLGLASGKNYYGKGYQIQVQYKNSFPKWETLLRTTPKSAYITCFGYKNNERRIPISSILRVRRVA